NLVAFHYGNLTHPSVDPPRIGLLSRVPTDADAKLTQAVNDAKTNGGNFENTIQIAPTASAATAAQVTVSDDPNAATAARTLTGGPASPTSAGEAPVVTIGMDGPNGGSKQNSASQTGTGTRASLVLAVVVGMSAALLC
ncbi:hypothetical protein V5O48_009904, partial [Marasmius crinis-equi]